ncbi:OmpA family protein [Membranihabitans marinus]|uniref:OmpA family protein n=1 Tax=Membranihabitans marinus TaxID=1227546 RepID=UPI001F47E40D|nr:OmpA family protein [Membranihabitans marinus]
MGKKTLFLIGILLTIIIGSYCYWVYCCGCCVKEEKSSSVMAQSNRPLLEEEGFPFNWSDNLSNNEYHCTDNFIFKQGQPIIVEPISDSVDIGIDKLRQHLVNNSERDLLITGYYGETEAESMPNLGLKRAEAIKEYLVSKGLNPAKIYLASQLTDQLNVSNNNVMKSSSLKIGSKDEFGDVLLDLNYARLTTGLKAHPLNIYFDYNRDKLAISQAKTDSLNNIIDYLKEVPGSKIKLVGHTDNRGNPNYNMVLGKKRAEILKAYLINRGIDSSVIEVESAGQTRPIASNDSSAGRSLNRRTEITIQ